MMLNLAFFFKLPVLFNNKVSEVGDMW
jgi:hypothetical protein